MKILLDYFFPITTVEATPAASTAFLKQVCLVVKPAAAVETGVVTLCTSMSAVEALTDNEDAQALFDAGLNRVYILPMDDLDLDDVMETDSSKFFTLLISSDFSDEEVGSSEGETVVGVKASLKIQDITYTAKSTGSAGNSTTINYNSGGTAGAEVIGVVGQAITVTMQDGVSTADNIRDAIENSVAAAALVDLAVDSGDENDVQAVFGAAVALVGGVTAVSGDGLSVGVFKGVVGVSSDDTEFLADQNTIPNRNGFYTIAANDALNMCYAFGKLLSNSVNWLNQQYISMPEADDVETLGDANALFDDKISFVISDDEFGKRLGLFAAGGKAIVAPYIKRNLEIDLQSAALSYISANMPGYTNVQAALLEDELDKVVKSYISRQWIESGSAEVKLEQENFVASGYFVIAEPKALWRIFGQITQTN